MKKLSNEEKAKAYDEALAKAIKIHRNYKGRVRAVDVVIEEVFPEVQKSKDERIRKVIYGWIYTQPLQFFDNGFSKEEMLTWLEKQGEQKPADKVEPKFKVGDNIEPIDSCLGSPRTIYKICDGWYETNRGTLNFEFEKNWRLVEKKPAFEMKTPEESLGIDSDTYNKIVDECIYGEQKPDEWSEEDDKILKSIIINIENLQFSEDMREKYHHIPNANKSYYQIKIDWLKSIKNRVQPQQEWSKEDEGYYDAIIAKLEVTQEDALLTDNEMDFLKSLEERILPKSTWNEEDMTKLKSAITLLQNPLIACDEVNDSVRIKTVDWLKSIENKVLLQSKQEWSEEDERIYRSIMYSFAHNYPLTVQQQEFVKSFKERYTWKPSDEQMTQLKKYCPDNRPLTLLYEQLKKLINEK